MGKKTLVISFAMTEYAFCKGEVLQVNVMDGEGNTLLHALCKPQKTHEWKVESQPYGITPLMVENAYPFELYVPLVRWLIETADEVLAYDAFFEPNALACYGIFPAKPLIDVMSTFKQVYDGEPRRYPFTKHYAELALETAARYYKYPNPLHEYDALDMVKATLYVYNNMFECGVKPVFAQSFEPLVAVGTLKGKAVLK